MTNKKKVTPVTPQFEIKKLFLSKQENSSLSMHKIIIIRSMLISMNIKNYTPLTQKLSFTRVERNPDNFKGH